MTSATEAKVYEQVLPNGEATDEKSNGSSRALCAAGKAHRASSIAKNAS